MRIACADANRGSDVQKSSVPVLAVTTDSHAFGIFLYSGANSEMHGLESTYQGVGKGPLKQTDIGRESRPDEANRPRSGLMRCREDF
ncbi:hypothetical protein KSS87_004396 [Heliosperma pusillum]|nr:hypothetical protein KSS87_004396 [Heliosperma pusillum]